MYNYSTYISPIIRTLSHSPDRKIFLNLGKIAACFDRTSVLYCVHRGNAERRVYRVQKEKMIESIVQLLKMADEKALRCIYQFVLHIV